MQACITPTCTLTRSPSRVQFYASVFQSIAATEARFHAEIAKVDEEFAVMMDKLAAYAATGIHSTKKERSIDPT